jgi:hypothetical protein
MTEAAPWQQAAALALGAVNLVGVAFLAVALSNPANQYALARQGLAWVSGAMPFLQVRQGLVC